MWPQALRYVIKFAYIAAVDQYLKVEEQSRLIKKLMRTDRPEKQVGGDSWVGYVLGTSGCIKEGYQLGYDENGIHYTYFDRVEWLCWCGLVPYLEQLQREVDILQNSLSEDGICMAPIAEMQLKGFSTYGGQQLKTDWKTPTRRFCDITFRALLIMHYSEG